MAEDTITQRANFARQFIGTAGPTQRAQYRRDLDAAAQRDEERRAMEFEQAQLQDPQLMNAVTARERESRMIGESLRKNDLAERKFQFDIGKEERANLIAQERLKLSTRSEERLQRKELLELQRQDKIEDSLLGVEEDEAYLRNSGVVPGTREYQSGMKRILMKYPHLPKEFRETALADIGLDPKVLLDEGASEVTVRPSGVTATFKTPDPRQAQNDLTQARKLWDKAKTDGADPSTLDYFERLVRKEEENVGKLGGVTGAPESAVTQPSASLTPQQQFEEAASKVKPGETFQFQGKVWRKPSTQQR